MDFLDIQVGPEGMVINASEDAPVQELITFLAQNGGIESEQKYAGICG